MIRERLVLMFFCFSVFIFTGCLTFEKIENQENLKEQHYNKIFVESFPSIRPDWVDSVPQSDNDLVFVGVSNYLANEANARDDARNDAFNQIVKYYGTIIKNTASENKSVKSLASDVIDPYIESEELIQSFAERYVSEIIAENYYTEKYLIDDNQEQWLCYVKCSVSKEKVRHEIDSFASAISERYSALLPERQANKYNSLLSAVNGYLSVYKTIKENPIYQAIAYIETPSGKAALDEYSLMQAKRIVLDCKMVAKDYKPIVEKRNTFEVDIFVSSSDFDNVSGMNTNVSLVSNGHIIANTKGNINSQNIVEAKIDTTGLDYGKYSLNISLVNDVGQCFLGEIIADSVVIPFEVVPIYAGIKFIYSDDIEYNEQIERKILDVLQDSIQTNNINIYIDNTRLKEDSFVFEIYLNAERLTSHESVVKTKVIGNVSFKKNGIIQAKSKDFEGLGLSKDFKRSILSATEQAASEFSVDNNFLSKINIISLGE